MNRTVTFVCALWNPRKRVMASTANTVEELKQEMAASDIPLNDMDMFEGISQSTLTSGRLPENVSFKGNLTNDLVIALSPKKQKIKSGNERGDLYNLIKTNNWKQEFFEEYGKNYTNASTDILKEFVNYKNNQVKSSYSSSMQTNNENLSKIDSTSFTNAINKIEEGISSLKQIFSNSIIKSPYSDEEIDKMFN